MKEAPTKGRARFRIRRSLPFLFAALVVLVGLFAPILANDVPLVARVDGAWSFPAFRELVGEAPPGPADQTWKQWWARLDPGSPDFAVMPPWSYGPLETDVDRFSQGPSLAHPLGCDDTGRDVLSRLVHGAAAAMQIGVPAVLLAGLLGCVLGAFAGMRGGLVDAVVLRLVELFVCFPMLVFLLFAAAFFGDSRLALVLVMATLFWTSFARIVRGELLSLREREFVATARGLGVSERRIFFRHLLPQLQGQIGVTAAFCMAAAVVAESTLAYLGVGAAGESSWGTMLRQGGERAVFGAWHLWLFPAIAVVAVVTTCHTIADRLRPPAAS